MFIKERKQGSSAFYKLSRGGLGLFGQKRVGTCSGCGRELCCCLLVWLNMTTAGFFESGRELRYSLPDCSIGS